MKKVLIFIFLISICFIIYNFNDIVLDSKSVDHGDIFLFKKIISGMKKYYGATLWVKIDENYHLKKGFDQEKQIAMLELFNKLDPENLNGLIYLSVMYIKLENNPQKSLDLLDDFVKKYPENLKIHKVLGEIGYINLFHIKDLDKAENALYTALQSSARDKNIMDDSIEFLFPLNYMRMLRFIYKEKGNKEYFDLYDRDIKRFIKEEGEDTEKIKNEHILYSDEKHDHSDDEECVFGHSHEHFSEDFIFNDSKISYPFILFIILSLIILIYKKFIKQEKYEKKTM